MARVKAMEEIKVRVEGRGHFPIDMLRYDNAYPANETASARIIDTFWPSTAPDDGPEKRPERAPVEIVCTANGAPNEARFASFGWRVTHYWTGYEWAVYSGQRVRK